MNANLSPSVIDSIILSKSLDEFYMVITEKKNKVISPDIIKKMENELIDENNYSALIELMNMIVNTSDRQVSVVTIINDKPFDLINHTFINLDERMILCYDSLTVQIKEDSFNIKYNQALRRVTFDTNYDYFMTQAFQFEQTYSTQCNVVDKTEEFIGITSKKRKK